MSKRPGKRRRLLWYLGNESYEECPIEGDHLRHPVTGTRYEHGATLALGFELTAAVLALS